MTYTYDAYGTVQSSTGNVTNPFQYAGQYTDSESGLQYLRTRYYDPNTQQFLTVDPLASQTGQPYAYAGDNPINAVDPSGMCGDVPVVPCPGDVGNAIGHIVGQVGNALDGVSRGLEKDRAYSPRSLGLHLWAVRDFRPLPRKWTYSLA